jgi:GT2 family glycosyltransferase
MEIIVVDDASLDSTASIASRYADLVIQLEGGARGPAFARNRGVESAHADLVAFVDADVMLHRDALSRMLAHFADPATTAVFGSYDDTPTDTGIVSQYRNLLHHRVHYESAGKVASFWAGCGAIRRNAFTALGGFDERRFHRPEMEDVELGYRLNDSGANIVLDPEILCTHRKRWTLSSMIISDFSRRAVPWTRLLIERGKLLSPQGPSLGRSQVWSVLLAALTLVLLGSLLIARNASVLCATIATIALFVLVNARLFAFFYRDRGLRFAIVAAGLHFIYNVVALSALVYGGCTYRYPSRASAL